MKRLAAAFYGFYHRLLPRRCQICRKPIDSGNLCGSQDCLDEAIYRQNYSF